MEKIDKRTYQILVAVALFTLTTGTIVYHISEKLSWVNAYYFSVVTLTTVGYGDIVPKTTFAKIFTTFYILVGVGIVTTFISVTMRRRGQIYEEKHMNKKKEEDK